MPHPLAQPGAVTALMIIGLVGFFASLRYSAASARVMSA
jgi:hypothetical protein